MMGTMHTYYNSKSLAHNIEERGAFLYPDEKFAREIMQVRKLIYLCLFTFALPRSSFFLFLLSSSLLGSGN
jgi:hypothetical protein